MAVITVSAVHLTAAQPQGKPYEKKNQEQGQFKCPCMSQMKEGTGTMMKPDSSMMQRCQEMMKYSDSESKSGKEEQKNEN